jgi:type 1 fimbriae regulatory protein FimB
VGVHSLNRDEVLRLLERAKACSQRDYLMILLAFNHGLRASEITSLTPEHLADGFLSIQRLKGSMRTTQPLIEGDEPILNERVAVGEFIKGMPGTKRLFPICRQTFWRCVQRHAKAIGLPAHKRNTKMLKHSIALQTIKLAGIENVRTYLGHKSLSSTGAYLKVNDEEASAAIKKALQT